MSNPTHQVCVDEIVRTPEFFKWFKEHTLRHCPDAFWHSLAYASYDIIEHEIGSDLGGAEELAGHNEYYVSLYLATDK